MGNKVSMGVHRRGVQWTVRLARCQRVVQLAWHNDESFAQLQLRQLSQVLAAHPRCNLIRLVEKSTGRYDILLESLRPRSGCSAQCWLTACDRLDTAQLAATEIGETLGVSVYGADNDLVYAGEWAQQRNGDYLGGDHQVADNILSITKRA